MRLILQPVVLVKFVLLFGFGFATTAYASPSINNVVGSASIRGEVITLHGSGFGKGPNVLVFDDFERGSAGGSAVGTPLVGEWSGVSGSQPLIAGSGNSGTKSLLAYDTEDGRQKRGFAKQFERTDSFFLSFWVHIPPGTKFPGKGENAQVENFSADSSWKFAWVYDGDDGFKTNDKFDLCIPTHTGNGVFQLAGNSITNWQYIGNSWWNWQEWMRVTAFISTNNARNSMFQTLSESRGLRTNTYANAPASDGKTDRFDRMTIPGWIRTGVVSNFTPLYDDIYVASGATAQARVEVGNGPDYQSASQLMIVPTTGWSSQSINAKIPAGLNNIPNPHIFVTDENGNTSQGIPLDLEASIPRSPTLFASS